VIAYKKLTSIFMPFQITEGSNFYCDVSIQPLLDPSSFSGSSLYLEGERGPWELGCARSSEHTSSNLVSIGFVSAFPSHFSLQKLPAWHASLHGVNR